MKKSLYILLLLLVCVTARAQHVRIEAPNTVEAGSKFPIRYSVEASDVSSFKVPDMPAGVEVLMGPSRSQMSSFQYVNGRFDGSTTVTVTYVVAATHSGTITLPAAHVVANGRRISSAPKHIRVVGGDAEPQQEKQSRAAETVGTPGKSDLFILVSASKRRVREQEPVMLTYKVYADPSTNLKQLSGAMPDLNGFHTQEVKLPQQKTFHPETLHGKTYNVVTWSQYIMYPQITGKLTVPPITYHGIVEEQDRSGDPYFMGGGYRDVERDVTAPGITIQVDPLPAKPKNFSGGVGHFTISAQMPQTDVRTGDPINMRVVLGGTGNLKLIPEPNVNLPKDFDKYDTKITDKTKLSESGVEGNMIYDYMFVARKEGTYTIPPITFTYYDTSANAYKTITTQSFTLHVAKGDDDGGISSYGNMANQDIRPIHTGNTSVHPVDDFFFGSVGYWIVIILLAAVFIALLYGFRQTALRRADVIGSRRDNASKVATKRLRRADELMLKGRSAEFYDEVLRALWGYVGDRLNIPVEKLSADNINEKLAGLGVPADIVEKFIKAVQECEFERYAPGDPAGNMNRTMESAMTAIMGIENSLNEKKRDASAASKDNNGGGNAGPVATVILLLMMLVPTASMAITKQNADAEYQRQNYQQAIADYKELLKGGVSADLYYNLGNAYYRTDNITQAILAYERAHLLAPGNSDIRFNLELARSKTIDKITPESEMFFVTWYRALVNMMSVDGWAAVAIISLIAAIVAILLYLFSQRTVLRRAAFYGGVVLVVVFLLANVFAFQQRSLMLNRTGAIITTPTVTVKKGPSVSSGDNFVIHEGTRVDIIDKSLGKWYSVRLADGREGWIQSNLMEEI